MTLAETSLEIRRVDLRRYGQYFFFFANASSTPILASATL